MNEDILKYSSDASSARYLFYQDINEINIFVEDADKEYEYETIFKRLLGDKYKIKSILSAGGKIGVRNKFEELGPFNLNNHSIKNVYIVDGDFNRYICQSDMIESPNFIYLEAYNIENYFVDEEASIRFIKGRLKSLDSVVKQTLDFKNWKNTIVGQATKLFVLYCVIQKFHPNISTTSRKHGEFLDSTTGFERQDNGYMKLFETIKNRDENLEVRIEQIKGIYKEINGDDFYNLICGKFLLTSLCWHIRNVIDSKFDHSDFRWHLINNFDIKKLSFLKNKVNNLLS